MLIVTFLLSPIFTLEEAENLAKAALDKEVSIEGVVLLRGIYAEKKEMAKFEYWDEVLKRLEKNPIYIENDWPNIDHKLRKSGIAKPVTLTSNIEIPSDFSSDQPLKFCNL